MHTEFSLLEPEHMFIRLSIDLFEKIDSGSVLFICTVIFLELCFSVEAHICPRLQPISVEV